MENEETSSKIPTYFFSIGHRCSASGILKNLKLKTESYPFDWIVSNLSTIRHCITTDFTEFLKPENYQRQDTITFNQLDGRLITVCSETPEVNTYYENQSHCHIGHRKKREDKICTYWTPVALTHHSMLKTEDFDYYKRCVSRFWERMESGYWEKKRYLYLHPYIGVYEYDLFKHSLRKEWEDFSRFMARKMGDVFGIFIVPVFLDKGMGNRDIVWEELFRSKWAVGWKVEFSNWNFIDAGATFSGEYEQELRNIEALVRKEFWEVLPDSKTREDLDSVVLQIHSTATNVTEQGN